MILRGDCVCDILSVEHEAASECGLVKFTLAPIIWDIFGYDSDRKDGIVNTFNVLGDGGVCRIVVSRIRRFEFG